MQELSNTKKDSVSIQWQSGAVPIDYMSDDFASVYELTGNRVTAPIAVEALRQIGTPPFGAQALDIAAGAGALSIPAAHQGLRVRAVDISPGMINLLSERLKPFPLCTAEVMNGEDLHIADNSMDLAFSIMGVSFFNDWRKGLLEMSRVLRPGGKACLGTWRTLPGGGPFLVMARALRMAYPDKMPPAPPEGFRVLADPLQLSEAMHLVGLDEVKVTEFETIWQGFGGQAYLDTLQKLHLYMAPYASLDVEGRYRVDQAVLEIITEYTVDGLVRIPSVALLAVGTK